MEPCIRLRNVQSQVGGRVDVGIRREFSVVVYGRDPAGREEVGVPLGLKGNGTAVA